MYVVFCLLSVKARCYMAFSSILMRKEIRFFKELRLLVDLTLILRSHLRVQVK